MPASIASPHRRRFTRRFMVCVTVQDFERLAQVAKLEETDISPLARGWIKEKLAKRLPAKPV